ncbi:MAG: hypothetical protein Q9203_002148 [Teloschistes exilis]
MADPVRDFDSWIQERIQNKIDEAQDRIKKELAEVLARGRDGRQKIYEAEAQGRNHDPKNIDNDDITQLRWGYEVLNNQQGRFGRLLINRFYTSWFLNDFRKYDWWTVVHLQRHERAKAILNVETEMLLRKMAINTFLSQEWLPWDKQRRLKGNYGTTLQQRYRGEYMKGGKTDLEDFLLKEIKGAWP